MDENTKEKERQGAERKRYTAGADSNSDDKGSYEPPKWFKIRQVGDLPKEPTPTIIPNLWRQQEVLLIGSHAKSWKSWNLMDLMFTIANGFPWLAWSNATPGRILYIDLELSEAEIRNRFEWIRDSYGIGTLDLIDILSLRGVDEFDFEQFAKLKNLIQAAQYTALAFDPTYRLLAGSHLSESDGGVIIKLMNIALGLARATQAGVALLQHFSKGDQSAKRALEAFSGAGAWGRAPDTCITFRELATEKAFQVTSDFRAWPPLDPFAVSFELPRFRLNSHLDPDDLKKPPPKTQQKKFTVDDLCQVIDDDEYISSENLLRRLGWKKRTLERRTKDARDRNWLSLRVSDDTWFLTPSYLAKFRPPP